ncbi:FadR/GntR family transcriptional regulator [Bauldia sp.]|uniref:FadR/GntR family transcriptional regulator n=1 Tax=Bauldia sp. TaxID=2575872 RepID=UPI003BAD4486
MTQSRSFRVYEDILDLIRSGTIAPGGRMPNERKLAALNGATRTQVRDALLMLQKEGLVERKIGSGTYLSDDAPKIIEMGDAGVDLTASGVLDFQETLEARLYIEPRLAAKVAEAGDPAAFDALRTAADATAAARDWLTFKEAIYQFSRCLYVAAGNDFLVSIFDQILASRRRSNFDGRQSQAPVADLVRTHMRDELRAIADTVASGDPAVAEAAVRQYLIGLAASSAH